MTASRDLSGSRSRTGSPPPTAVKAVGFAMAVWCLGFAAVNVVFEATDHFADGAYASYASGFSVLNWLVVGLKLPGAAVALLSVADRQRLVSPTVLTALAWGAFSTLGIYALGGAAQAVGMLAGLNGSADRIDPAGVAYLLLFAAAAAGFGVLAVSYYRRNGRRTIAAILGAVGAPAVLGLLFVAVGVLLTTTGMLPAS